MSEAHRSDAHDKEALNALDAGADRDAKIEQLLLLGLDHYFSAQYEQAINVWTRALFLDRSHARARAYIERARSALAERQRESEEMLQHGVEAFRRGDGGEARRLLQAAIAGGAPAEEALALLERLNRLEPLPPIDAPSRPRPEATSVPAEGSHRSRRGLTLAALMLATLGIAAYAAAATGRLDWWRLLRIPEPAPAIAGTPVVQEMSLPLPRRSEIALSRARALAADGHLRDALAALESVRPTDPQKPDADRLRGELQRQLLALTTTGPPAAPVSRGKDAGRDR